MMPLPYAPGSLATMIASGWPVVADASLKGAILLAVAGLSTLAMRRSSASQRHLVWLLAVGSTLALPMFSALLPAWRILPHWPSGNARATVASPPIEPAPAAQPIANHRSMEPSHLSEVLREKPLPAAAVNAMPEPSPIPLAPPAWWTRLDWEVGLAAAWALGMAALVFRYVLGVVFVWRIGRQGRPVEDPRWRSLLDETARGLGVRRRVVLRESPRCSIPMTWGTLRPVILVPMGAGAWPGERRHVVLAHELAHVKRCDCLAQLVAQAARALYWFNPLVWLAWRRLLAESERACDDLVLVQGCSKASDYAEHLLTVASGAKPDLLLASATIAMARPSQLQGRLLAILDAGRNRRRLTWLGILVASALLVAVVIPLAIARQRTGTEQLPLYEKAPVANDDLSITVGPNRFSIVQVVRNDREGKPHFEDGRGNPRMLVASHLDELFNNGRAWDVCCVHLQPPGNRWDMIEPRVFDHATRERLPDVSVERVIDGSVLQIARSAKKLPDVIDLWFRAASYASADRLVIMPAGQGKSVSIGNSTITIREQREGFVPCTLDVREGLGKIAWREDLASDDGGGECMIVFDRTGGPWNSGRYQVCAVDKQGRKHFSFMPDFVNFGTRTSSSFGPPHFPRADRVNDTAYSTAIVHFPIPLEAVDHFEWRPFGERYPFYFDGVRLPKTPDQPFGTTPLPRFANGGIFIPDRNGKDMKGLVVSLTQPYGASTTLTCDSDRAVSMVEWRFLHTSPGGDVYEITLTWIENRGSILKISTQVPYAGTPVAVSWRVGNPRDRHPRILLLPKEAVPPAATPLGRVVDAQGKGIAKATVKRINAPWTATTETNGWFPLPELKLGEAAPLSVSAEGFLPLKDNVDLFRNTKGDYSITGKWPIQLFRPVTLSGRVLGLDGKPLAGAPLSLDAWTRSNNSSCSTGNFRATTTDEQGRFAMEQIPPGSHVLYYPGAVYRSLPAKGVYGSLVIEPADGQKLSGLVLDLSQSTASIEGRVFGPDGKPMAGATVHAGRFHQWNDWSGGSGPHPSSPETGADGRYKLTGVGPGPWQVTPSHPHFQRGSPFRIVTLAPGQTVHEDLRVTERDDIVGSRSRAADEAERTDDLRKLDRGLFALSLPPVDRNLATFGSLIFLKLPVGAANDVPIYLDPLCLPRTAAPEEAAKVAHCGELYFAPPDHLVTINGTIVALFKPASGVGAYESLWQGMTRAKLVEQIEASRRQNPGADGRRIAVKERENYLVVRSDEQGYLMHVGFMGKSGVNLSFVYLGHLRLAPASGSGSTTPKSSTAESPNKPTAAVVPLSTLRAVGDDQGGEQATRLKTDESVAQESNGSAFQRGVGPSFEKLPSAEFAYLDPENQRKMAATQNRVDTEVTRKWRLAEIEFQEQVAAHWPYHDPKLEQQQAAIQNARNEMYSLFSRAQGGRLPPIDREEAVRRILQLTHTFPDSPLSDEAGFLAAHLFWDVKPPRPNKFRELMQAVANSKSPLNGYKIMAMTDLASWPDADADGLRDRERFSARMRDLRRPGVLKVRLLNPLPTESQDRYVNRVLSVLSNIEGHYQLNALNMIEDTMRTADPQASLDQLRKSEADNPYLQRELKRRGLDKPLREKTADLLREFKEETFGWKQGEVGKKLIATGDKSIVPELAKMLTWDSRAARCNAGWGLAKLGDDRGLFAVIAELKDKKPRPVMPGGGITGDGRPNVKGQIEQDRYYAAWVLGAIGDRRAVPALLETLGDKSINYEAALALGEIGDPRAAPPLKEMVKIGDPTERLCAGEALAKLGDPLGIPTLAALLKEPNWVDRRRAAEVLGDIGGRQAVGLLTAALKDKEVNVRAAAARSLGKLADASAIPALQALAKERERTTSGPPVEVREVAAQALEQIQHKTPTPTR